MKKDTNITLLALLGGAAVGVGIGIFLSSEKGSVTRRRLLEGINDGARNLKDTFESTAQTLRGKLNHVKNDIEGTYDDLQPNLNYKNEDEILFL